MGNTFFKQSDREKGIRRLISINLLKRLESSVHSFRLTVNKIKNNIDSTIETIDTYGNTKDVSVDDISSVDDVEIDDQNTDLFVGNKVKISLRDIDTLSWKEDLKEDSEVLYQLLFWMNDITPEHDNKLQSLFKTIENKINNPINEGNKKVIVFSYI